MVLFAVFAFLTDEDEDTVFFDPVLPRLCLLFCSFISRRQIPSDVVGRRFLTPEVVALSYAFSGYCLNMSATIALISWIALSVLSEIVSEA